MLSVTFMMSITAEGDFRQSLSSVVMSLKPLLEQFLGSVFVWPNSGLFEESMSVILEGVPWFRFVWCFCVKLCIPFQIIEIQIKCFWQECHKSNVGSWCITLEDTWCQFVPLVEMITSLRGFSSGKLLLSFNVSCEEILWDCVNILSTPQTFTRFSIHGWFLVWINCYNGCQMVISNSHSLSAFESDFYSLTWGFMSFNQCWNIWSHFLFEYYVSVILTDLGVLLNAC